MSYPLPALRETLVNAVYHRGYDVDQPEPTKVCLYPNRVEVISYPGPVPGIEARHLVPNAQARAVPARNRRIGEFLKELGLAEGRLTGLPRVFQAMEANGSPTPRFEFAEKAKREKRYNYSGRTVLRCSDRTPWTRPSWLDARVIPVSRTGISNALVKRCMPTPVHCLSSRKPRSGCPATPCGITNTTPAAGFSTKPGHSLNV